MQKQIIEKEKVQTKLPFKIIQYLFEVIHPNMGVESMTHNTCVTHMASVYRFWKPIVSMYRFWKPSIIHNAIHVTQIMKHKTMNTKNLSLA
jgi:hypothetical protein